jgi:glycosyltransferase involved in cell wall biosynthesis
VRLVIHAWRDLANPSAGGSERHVDQLARAMVDRGHHVALVAGGPVGPRRYPVVCSGGTYSQYLNLPFVDRRLEPADLVVDVANGMTFCTPLWNHGPVLLMLHHVHLEQWGSHFPAPVAVFGRAFESRLVPRIYRDRIVVACSPSTGTSLAALGYDPELVRVVVPGIATGDPASHPPARSPDPSFVAVGRLMPYKRVDLLLALWRRVRPHVGGTLHVVGDGPQRAALEAAAGPGVVFHGQVDEQEKHRLLAESWLLVHAASHEGWGIVISEAGTAGTPTLAFDVAGVRDAAAHDVSGVLVDDDDGFVDAWIALAGDPVRRRRLGDSARATAARHDERAAGDAFEAACLEAVARHRVRGR